LKEEVLKNCLENRLFVDFDKMRPYDIVFINLKKKAELFFLGHREGYLKHELFYKNPHNDPHTTYKFFFFHKTREEILKFLKEKAAKAGLEMHHIGEENEDVVEVCFEERPVFNQFLKV
jgi:hypothetical protein